MEQGDENGLCFCKAGKYINCLKNLINQTKLHYEKSYFSYAHRYPFLPKRVDGANCRNRQGVQKNDENLSLFRP